MTTPRTLPDFSALVAVIEQQVTRADSTACRVRWLLELAAALDHVSFDGAADLASAARSEAARLIGAGIAWVAGRQS